MPIYLNNAATTYPKPPEVLTAAARELRDPPIEPGRSGHGADPVLVCRNKLAELFAVADPRKVTIFPSATHALNAVILGLLGKQNSSHVIATTLEHNSILRPLEHLRRSRNLRLSLVEPACYGRIVPVDMATLIDDRTQLIVISHASNVTGCIQPVAEIAEIAASAEIPLLIDASQSAGAVEINHDNLPGRVFLATAGHKGLYGPAGVGVLVLPDENLPQTLFGGTGVRSDSRLHPIDLPLRHEAGTMNLSGIAGLCAGVNFVMEQGVSSLGAHRHSLVSLLRERLSELPGCRLSPLADGDGRAGITSFMLDGWHPEELGCVLRESFDIEVRAGLHCAPLAWAVHAGSVRASVGAWNTEQDIEKLVEALERVSAACVA